jgi:hypothetical protein
MIARRLVAFALLAAAPALAQNDVDDLFAGVGVEWGWMLDEVKDVFPGGATHRLNATDFNYEVNDARPIFGLDRAGGDLVSFGFVDGVLGNMRIQFPDCAALATAVARFVGPPDLPGETIGDDATLLGTWQGSSVTLTATSVIDCALIVTRPL